MQDIYEETNEFFNYEVVFNFETMSEVLFSDVARVKYMMLCLI